MGFYDRFQLLDLVRDDGIRTFRAREISTGRLVEAHLIPPESAETLKILLKLDFISPDQKWRILERSDHEGTTCIATEPLADYPGFREWLVAKSGTGPERPSRESVTPNDSRPTGSAVPLKSLKSRPPSASCPEEAHTSEKRRLDTEGGWRIVSPDPLDRPEPAAHTLALPTYRPRQGASPPPAVPAQRPKPPGPQPPDSNNPHTSPPQSDSWSAAATPTVAIRTPRPPAASLPAGQTPPPAAPSSLPSAGGPSTPSTRRFLLLIAILVAVASLVAFVALR